MYRRNWWWTWRWGRNSYLWPWSTFIPSECDYWRRGRSRGWCLLRTTRFDIQTNKTFCRRWITVSRKIIKRIPTLLLLSIIRQLNNIRRFRHQIILRICRRDGILFPWKFTLNICRFFDITQNQFLKFLL